MILETEDDQLMAMSAFRYCLGRQTYMVGVCIDWLRIMWPQFTRNTKHVIVRDIVTALLDEFAGSAVIDAPGWKAIVCWMYEAMDGDDRASVLREFEWKGKSEALAILEGTPSHD